MAVQPTAAPIKANKKLISPAILNGTPTQVYACTCKDKYDCIAKNCAVPGKYHTGLDMIGVNKNAAVLAVRSGFVTHHSMGDFGTIDNHCMGNIAILKANDGYFYVYAHLSAFIKSGVVDAGDEIGRVGDTGYNADSRENCRRSAGPHLHLEKKLTKSISDSSGIQWGYTKNHPDSSGYASP